MTVSDETLMAYVDGELDDATHAAVEAAIAIDPDLARRVADQVAVQGRLRSEFDPVLAEAVPERLVAAARGTSKAIGDGNVFALRHPPARQWAWPQWGALAASLILGILIAPLLRRAPVPSPLEMSEEGVLASGALAQALSQQLASNQSADGPVHIGISFRSHSGDYCRTFELRDKSAVAGLACREGQSWRLEALAHTRPDTTAHGAYQPAASSLPPMIGQSVDTLITGEPLDAKAEAAARRNGWH